MTVDLFPADIYNQKTIQQGHPPGWTNRAGGEYDLVVLGGGPAGLVTAMTAAAGGHRVAMTEQRLTGGTCVNFGCTPSKALIRCRQGFVYQHQCVWDHVETPALRLLIWNSRWCRVSCLARPGAPELTVDGGPRVRIRLPPAESLRTFGT